MTGHDLRRLRRHVGLIVFLVVAADQLAKFAVLSRLTAGQLVSLIPGALSLTLTYNKGIAFGLLADVPDVPRQLIISFSIAIALFVLVYFMGRAYLHDRWAVSALALIVGGAIGNVVDRVRLGHVVDFIDVYYRHYHWPAFNIADSCVCIGVVLLLLRPTAQHSDKSIQRDC